MITKQTFSIDFHSDDLNKAKVELFKAKASTLLNFRNEISKKISDNILKYLNYSNFDFINEFYTQLDHCSAAELTYSIQDVAVSYQNKFDKINSKISFKKVESIKYIKYKKATKSHQKGDLKEISYKRISTNLTKALTFLAKYDIDEEYLRNKIDFSSDSHKVIYQNCIYYIDKFGYDRLKRLARSKASNLFSKYNKKPIEFHSLSYRSSNRFHQILEKSNNSKQLWMRLYEFKDLGRNKQLFVPIKYNRKYHGKNLEEFAKTYIVQFQNDKVRFILSKEGSRNIATNKKNYIGADVNLKHNLIATKDFQIDIDRQMLKCFQEFLPKYDKNKEKHEKKYKIWLRRFDKHLKRKCSEFVDECIKQGKDHIVLEDIQAFGRMFAKDEVGTKYSRLSRILHLNDLKNIIISIANKKDIAVSLVPSHYTSQQCSKCGYISRDNRMSQEKFVCMNCGHSDNADQNASINIASRVSSNVLRESLLKEVYPWVFRPKNLSKLKIRSILEDTDVQTFNKCLT